MEQVKIRHIALMLKKEKGYKIGIITTVGINHATPAGFYAHVASRNDYYKIGEQLTESDFDYFGGGGFIDETGKEGDQESLRDVAKKAGYSIVDNNKDILALNSKSGKTMAINPVLDSNSDMNYGVDADKNELKLKDFVTSSCGEEHGEKTFRQTGYSRYDCVYRVYGFLTESI